MYKTPTFKIAIFITLFFFSCTVNNSNSSSTINLESYVFNFKEIKLFQLSNNIEYILLGADQQITLGDITGIDIDSRNILISDKNNCLLFDPTGKFISTIGKRGKGPGEFIFHGVAKIGTNNIFIPNTKNLLVYSKEGIFIKSIDNPTYFDNNPFNTNWLPLSDTVFICHVPNTTGNENNKAIIFNQKSDTMHLFKNHITFIKDRTSYNSDIGLAQFYFFNGELTYKEYMNDTLFRIKKNKKMEPAYIFNLGKYKFPDKDRGLTGILNAKKRLDFIRISKIYETSTLIFLKYFYGNKYPLKSTKDYIINGEIRKGQAPVLGIYNKCTEEVVFVAPSQIDDGVNPNGIENDLDGGMNFFPQFCVNDSTLLMIIQPFELKAYINNPDFKNNIVCYPVKKKELEKLANSLSENDNPVLMLVKLKE